MIGGLGTQVSHAKTQLKEKLVAMLKGLLGEVLNYVVRPVGRRRLAKSLRVLPVPALLEFGAGGTKRNGWVTTDVTWRSGNYLDVTASWPMADETVDFLFSDNVVEHLSLSGARVAFREACRVLKPGGVLRVVTPDIGELTQVYMSAPEESAALKVQLIQEGYLIENQVDLLRFAFQDDGHDAGYLWDKDALETELRLAGFSGVVFHGPGQSKHDQLRNLDLRVDTPLAGMMLAVEAEK